MSDVEPWIGLVEIVPDEDCELLRPGRGAYLNVLTLASSALEFATKVEQAMAVYKATVMSITDCAPYKTRFAEATPDDEIRELHLSLDKPSQVLLATLHTFPTQSR
jgi:hypothetical protein